MRYHSMNVNHLLDDEVEYELAVRAVKFTSGESRDMKRRKLRNAMRVERDNGKFISVPIPENRREQEFEMIDEKLARIKNKLENKKTKKAELPELETRMLHLYFRACRLNDVFDADGLDNIALKVLNDHFSCFTNDPQVNLNNSLKIIDQLRAFKDKNVEADDEEEDEGETTVKSSRVTSTPKRKQNVKNVKLRPDVEQMERMMSRVDRMITEKFNALSLEFDQKTERINRKLASVVEKPRVSERNFRREPSPPPEDYYDDTEESFYDEEVLEDSFEVESVGSIPRRRSLGRRPKAVSDWKIKYDGKDDGRGINNFIAEVEFMADAEKITKRTLFNEAIHLFSSDARAWYIEGRKNRDFTRWSELVTELKMEFQPPDMDFNYEQQAAQRRQRRSEKFQDYYKAIMAIFQQMSIPPSEQRMFDIIFRNMRYDYKSALLVKGIRTLKLLKAWGKKLDSVNSNLYRKDSDQYQPRSAQIHEVSRYQQQQGSRPSGGDWGNRPQTSRPEWRNSQPQNQGFRGPPKESGGQPKPQQERSERPSNRQNPQTQPSAQEGGSRGTLEARVAAYRVPDKTVCFNCRGNYHHFTACLKEKEIFCTNCGFHDFTAERCPVCAKNARKST